MNFTTAIVLLIILLMLYVFLHLSDFSLIFVKSSTDGRFHLVRNLPDKKKAANKMAEIKTRLIKLQKYMNEKIPKDPRVIRINNRFNIDSIQETRIDSHHTSFSVDKGQEIHLCLRDKSEDYKVHEINRLMFVSLHELAHVASVKQGHGEEFRNNFVWILEHATKIGIFRNEDYSAKNVKFCGDVINSNPLISRMRILKN